MFDQLLIYAAVALGIIVIAALLSTFFTVEQRTVAIVQRFGKFVREAGPGLNTKIPIIRREVTPRTRRKAETTFPNIIRGAGSVTERRSGRLEARLWWSWSGRADRREPIRPDGGPTQPAHSDLSQSGMCHQFNQPDRGPGRRGGRRSPPG